MSVLLSIFLLCLLAEIVNWIGSAVLLNIFYAIHQYLFHRSAVRQHSALKREVLASKQELLQTSAQDQFAKWAKLRRKVDKGLEDLEKFNTKMAATKSSYSLRFKAGLWLVTSGSLYVVGWMYGKQAVFFLPPGWFGPSQWLLALPFAPLGSVSVGVWQMSCRRVLKIGERIVKDFVGMSKVTAPGPEAEKSTVDKEKKEL
ncbi:hypothetical protein M422DRAFT_32546 [Sphaerobolus stellatus SS14]|uniref:Uncharacterized protein n=1 Tax=Sphaerobolus stellatus (strain SS14) TaxID=990650 RepID=A0A0C9VQ26_SPHS4|nr:hypothetical protein M422DRAFT_32546 [Sphaerobolus stellatus SS14]